MGNECRKPSAGLFVLAMMSSTPESCSSLLVSGVHAHAIVVKAMRAALRPCREAALCACYEVMRLR